MVNNITQVSPGNRVDFSHIRKALNGIKVPKMTIGGITHVSGDWYNTIFSSFREQMSAELAAAQTPEEKLAIIDKYNQQQSKYALLRPKFTNLSSVTFNQDVKNYQDLINKDFNFVNVNGINSGVTSGRYKKIGSAKRFGKDLADKWESDGYWAGQTQDRTTLGYKGDWNETSNNFKNWQDYLNSIGMETYLDSDNAYKLRLLQNPETPNIPEIPESTPEEPELPKTTPWEPVKYTPEDKPTRKLNLPTFPLYNAALLGVANITNKRILDTQLKAPSMRYQAPTLYGKVTNAYSERAANNQALQEYNWGVQQQLNNTSDLGRALEAQRDLLSQLLNVKLQNNKAKQDEYNQTSLNLQNINNTNILNWTNAANQNRQAYVAETRDRLNAIAQYQAQRGQNIQENIMSNYSDWKSWNRNNQLQDYSDWRSDQYNKVQQDLNQARENLKKSQDLESYQGYKDFWKNIYDKNGNPRADSTFGSAWATYIQNSGINENDSAARLKFFKDNYMNDAYKAELGGFLEGWQKYLNDAWDLYTNDYTKIQNRWNLTDSKNKPINFSGEISSWLYNKLNPKSSYKSIYSMKKGGRFLEYLEHNRKAEKDIRDATTKAIQNSRKLLARLLDALDRESLLLLRAIFK